MSTEDRIAEIRALTEAATPGPWTNEPRMVNCTRETDEHLGYEIGGPPGAERGQFAKWADAELVAKARGLLPWLLDQLEQARVAVQRVGELHAEALILDECEHNHPWSDVEAGTAWADEEIGVTCNILYRVCRECCITNGEQSEDCASGHKWHHGLDGHRCRTLRALEVPDGT